MYEVEDMQGYNLTSGVTSPKRRLETDALVQSKEPSTETSQLNEVVQPTDTTEFDKETPPPSTADPQERVKINMTGHGIAAIATMILFLVPVLIIVSCMMDIFVTTKQVDKPLLLGKIDY
jgi:hypothetical protein